MMATGFDVSGKRVMVLGAGRSGQAAAGLLVSRGADVTLADTGELPPTAATLRALGVRLESGPHRIDALTSVDLIVLSPGVPPQQEAIAAASRAGIPVIGEIELASRFLRGRIIAITGTKGKSTTTTLTALMLAASGFTVTAGGNLGTALSSQVDDSRADAFHVVEVSSFQLETIETFRPWIAALVNLSPDHQDRHASFDEYAGAKARIFENQTREDWAVVNADDPAAMSRARNITAKRCDFALDTPLTTGVVVSGDWIVRRIDGREAPLLPVSSVRVPGRHLLADVLAAAAIATIAGAQPAALQRAAEGFAGLEHALEVVGVVDDVTFVNDSKATNIVSARRAIESFERGVVVILGGRYKGGAFEDLIGPLTQRGTAVVAIGEAAPRVEAALHATVPVHRAATMQDAVRRAFAAAPRGGVVLLAPACSSFDMFQDYAARGRAFKVEAKRLAADVGGGKERNA